MFSDVVTADVEASESLVLPLKVESGNFDFFVKNGGAIKRLLNGERLEKVEFRNVNYTLHRKQRLFNVSCSTKPKEMLTIMGMTDSGKENLLALLGGLVNVRKGTITSHHLSGHFIADGVRPLCPIMREGFVTRSTANCPTNSVRDELEFSAGLRLPATVSHNDRAALIDDILASLSLTDKANTQVRNLSPLESALVEIGFELASIPNVLLLDEPTQDLDHISAFTLTKVLNRLAASGACVVVSTSDIPTSAASTAISHMLLLAQGRMIYRGDASGLANAFAAKKLIAPSNTNVMEYVLMWCDSLPVESLPSVMSDDVDDTTLNHTQILHKSMSIQNESKYVFLGSSRQRNRSFFVEVYYIFLREVRATLRDPRFFFGTLVLVTLCSIVYACVFIHAANQSNPNYFLGAHSASFLYPLFNSCFALMTPTVEVVSQIKPQFARERSLNVYGSLSFALARMIPELVSTFFLSCVTVLILYWAVGWTGNFMMFVLAFFLVFEVSISVGYLLAMSLSSVTLATALCSLVVVPQLMFMGAFIQISALPIELQWISYICYITYSIRLLNVVEFDPSRCTTIPICEMWAGLLESSYANASLIWLYVFILVVFIFVFRILSFLIIEWKIHRMKRLGEL